MSRILIAEDEPRLSGSLEKGLKAAGFDLLIVDIGLPGQDGFSVLRAIRSRGERMPVLILTARDYVTKPFVFEELLARVRLDVRTPTVRGMGYRLKP